ncbi:unnamed protein product [Urochloa decumbens]|uniref:RING-type domain-containing protein n=1 Tax=Urochloa decumbens TaxID=240449 RepID=A0ABC9EWT6_9POAL
METRIRCHHYKHFLNDGRDHFEPLEEGPSYLRLVCRATVRYALRRLGGGSLAEPGGKTSRTRTSESKHLVDDPSDFLDYDKTRLMVYRLFTSLRGLRKLDLAPSNWSVSFTPDVMADNIRKIVRDNENKGMCGGHYRFTQSLDVEVTLVFSEPKAVLGYCVENAMQTLDPATCGDPCGICLDGLMSSSRTPPVNLPCGHAFHSQCIAKWFFKGTACPLCRHDLRGLVAAPYVGEHHVV